MARSASLYPILMVKKQFAQVRMMPYTTRDQKERAYSTQRVEKVGDAQQCVLIVINRIVLLDDFKEVQKNEGKTQRSFDEAKDMLECFFSLSFRFKEDLPISLSLGNNNVEAITKRMYPTRGQQQESNTYTRDIADGINIQEGHKRTNDGGRKGNHGHEGDLLVKFFLHIESDLQHIPHLQ